MRVFPGRLGFRTRACGLGFRVLELHGFRVLRLQGFRVSGFRVRAKPGRDARVV